MSLPRITHDHFVIEREYGAPRAEVFAAWADPQVKAQWFIGPAGWTAVRRELDFRVGREEVLHGRFASGETLFRARYHHIEADAYRLRLRHVAEREGTLRVSGDRRAHRPRNENPTHIQ